METDKHLSRSEWRKLERAKKREEKRKLRSAKKQPSNNKIEPDSDLFQILEHAFKPKYQDIETILPPQNTAKRHISTGIRYIATHLPNIGLALDRSTYDMEFYNGTREKTLPPYIFNPQHWHKYLPEIDKSAPRDVRLFIQGILNTYEQYGVDDLSILGKSVKEMHSPGNRLAIGEKRFVENFGSLVESTGLTPETIRENVPFSEVRRNTQTIEALISLLKYSLLIGRLDNDVPITKESSENIASQAQGQTIQLLIDLAEEYQLDRHQTIDLFKYPFLELGLSGLMTRMGISNPDQHLNGIFAPLMAYTKLRQKYSESNSHRIRAGRRNRWSSLDEDRLGIDLVVETLDSAPKPIDYVQVKNDASLPKNAEYNLTFPTGVELIDNAINRRGSKLSQANINQLRNIVKESPDAPHDSPLRLAAYILRHPERSRVERELDTVIKLSYQAKQDQCRATWMILNENWKS